MIEPEEIVERALAVVRRPRDLAGLRVAISAGGTREPIDPVRFIGNRSSGRQGVALARAAADRGAEVTLVAAHTDDGVLADAAGPTLVRAGTAADMLTAMMDAAATADVVVMAAAVADYRPASSSDAKLTKEAAGGPVRSLELVETDDVLKALVGARRPGQTLVGFAAETSRGDELLARARRKLERKGADLLVVNEVGWEVGFEQASNEVVVLGRGGDVAAEASGTKREVADAVWDAVLAVRAAER